MSSALVRRPRPVLAAAAALALVLGACARARPGPRLHVEWIGADTGRFSGPATASWCPVARRLEVRGVKDDLGFGLVVYPESLLVPGEYPVFDPGIDTVHRPGSAGAARWFTEQIVAGFQSDSGGVQVLESGAAVRLRFGFRMRSLTGEDTLRAEGEATRLVPGACSADSVPNSAPIQ